MKRKLISLYFVALTTVVSAQTGGLTSFPFLDITYNARSAGLGGDFITAKDQDINIGIANPSLLNSAMNKHTGFNQAFLAGGINYGMVTHGFNVDKIGTMSGYLKYVSYGTFERTDVNGTSQGTFSPIDIVLGSGFGRQLNPRISIGVNLNMIYSQLESYSSYGAGIDLAGTFYNEKKEFLVTAMVKNAGIQFNTYSENSQRKPLPAEFQLAAAYKLPHAPFRISILAHHLNKWDLTYNDPTLTPTIDPLSGDIIPVPKANFVEKLARHFTFQVETIISKNIHLRTGFDYHRRKELALNQRPGIAGASIGLGLYFNKFSLDYGFVIYSRAGFNNMLTLTTDLAKWRK
ncbi:MAG: type IX secretion system protein PorQ [Crocinitomicaceae bacterium]|nr:type IX secretion system protein PorQ [Crocinitomicaceae bacterium]